MKYIICHNHFFPSTENATCIMMGPHIKTFDGQDIIYEICNNVAMKDIKNAKFNVTGNFALFFYNFYCTRNSLIIST